MAIPTLESGQVYIVPGGGAAEDPYWVPGQPTGGTTYPAGAQPAPLTEAERARRIAIGGTEWMGLTSDWPTAAVEPTPESAPYYSPASTDPTAAVEPTPWDPVRYQFPTGPSGPIYAAPIPTVQAPAPYDWAAEARRLAQTAQIQDIIGQLETGLGPIRTTLQELLSLSPEAIEERYQAQIEAPATRYFEEQTLPHLRRGFVGPGTYWSSMRAGAEQRAGETLREALMAQRAGMFGEQRQVALGAAQRAMELEEQAFTGRTYPYAMAMQAAPHEVQQRAQTLEAELASAQTAMQARAQELQRWATLEELKQRERETWGYAPTAGGAYSPTWPVPPPAEAGVQGVPTYTLGAAL